MDHAVMHAGSVALAVVTQLCSDALCAVAELSDVPNALFQNSLRNVSETFPLEVTMDWWSGNNWMMADIWSKAWLVEAAVSLCRRNVYGRLSCNPEVHPPLFYLIWATVNSARICCMFLWDRHDLLGATALMWMVAALSFYMLYVSYTNLDENKAWLAANNRSQIWWIRLLTQNGLALFAWWALFNALVGLGVVFKYTAAVPDPLISTVVLTASLMCALTWFVLQTFVLSRYMCYTFTAYPVLILGLGAMFTRSYRVHDLATNTVYCGFLMLLMTIMSIIHLISVCLHSGRTSKPVAVEPGVTFDTCVTVCRAESKSPRPLQN